MVSSALIAVVIFKFEKQLMPIDPSALESGSNSDDQDKLILFDAGTVVYAILLAGLVFLAVLVVSFVLAFSSM